MPKPTLVLLMVLLISTNAYSQAPSFDWAVNIGGTGEDRSFSNTLDGQGNVITVGQFSNTVDFDPGPSADNRSVVGGKDIFIQKMDGSGNYLWAITMGSTGNDRGFSVATDASDNIFVLGFFTNTVDFDPGLGTQNSTSNGQEDIFLLKLDANGNYLWHKTFGGNDGDEAIHVEVDNAGNIYMVGYFKSTVDFDPGAGMANHTSAGIFDIFVLKFDVNGDYLWSRSFGGSDWDRGQRIAVDLSGNIYVSGFFRGTVDFDPGPATFNMTSGGFSDVFAMKLDANGDFVWATSFTGPVEDLSSSISLGPNGEIYIGGWFSGTVDFDPYGSGDSRTAAGGYDAFVARLDNLGNPMWVNTYGGAGEDRGSAVKTDPNGDVYFLTRFSGTVDFDPSAGTVNVSSAGNLDAAITKLDPQGNGVWVISLGSTGNDNATMMNVYDNALYISGFFQGTVDFNPDPFQTDNLTSAGSDDVYVWKLDLNCITDTINITDTLVVNDTTTITDTLVFNDTTIITDTLVFNDTTTITDTLVFNDTTIITDTLIVNDTTIITDTLVINDTTSITDTLIVSDTTILTDTLVVTDTIVIIRDTLFVTDTIKVFDTIILSDRAGTLPLHENMTLYPNPTMGEVTIKSGIPIQGEINVMVMDVNGRLIRQDHYIDGDYIRFNIDAPAGLYIVTLMNDVGERAQFRVVKQ